MTSISVKPTSLLWGIFLTATSLVCATTIAGFASRWWWPFELACHFRVQCCWALVIAALLLIVAKKYRWSAGVFLFALVNLSLFAPCYLSKPRQNNDATTLRVLTLNVMTSNRRYDAVLKLAQATEPDVIVLVEIDAQWDEAMRALHPRYPYSHTEPQDGNFGVAIYSSIPLTHVEFVRIGQWGVPAVLARLEFEERHLTIIGGHVLPPVGRDRSQQRNRQLAELGRLAGSQQGAVILVGDLNITPWSPYFRDLLRDSKLRDSRQGFGVQPTWPVRLPLMRIPIDHCLVSKQVVVKNRRVGEDIGSDHYPVIIDISLRKP